MNILVTGANGQLGNEMRIVSAHSSHHFIFTDVTDILGMDTCRLDITDLAAVRTMVAEKQVDAIVNCAAWTNVDGAEDSDKYLLVEKLNAIAPMNLALAMSERGGLLIHISTDYVVGADSYNTPCTEEQTGRPTGVYGHTKLLGEQNIRNVFEGVKAEKRGLYLILRTAWLYSEFGKNFCKTMLQLTSTKSQIKVVFDQCGTPTYALDLANAIVSILDKIQTFPHDIEGIYNYSNEGVCSWYDFTKMIQNIAIATGYYESHSQQVKPETLCEVLPCHSDEFPSPVIRPAYSVLDKTKIKRTFGLTIPYWADSLKRCIVNIAQREIEVDRYASID